MRKAAAAAAVLTPAVALAAIAADPMPPDATYRPLPTLPFSAGVTWEKLDTMMPDEIKAKGLLPEASSRSRM